MILSYAQLSPKEQRAVDTIVSSIVEGINEYAALMERGEIEMMSGPKALRDFAGTLEVAGAMERVGT